MASNSFGARTTLKVGSTSYTIFKLDALEKRGFAISRLPFSIRVMLENVLRREDGEIVTADQIEALAKWNGEGGEREILLHAGARAAAGFHRRAGGGRPRRDARRDQRARRRPRQINPLQPADLVIDHSVQVDSFGTALVCDQRASWSSSAIRSATCSCAGARAAFDNFRVVPPDTGIVHQVNLEYLAPVVFSSKDNEAYPDTVFGTDSHTTMINGLGVVGWGVGGIEAEAAMLGRSMPMLIPEVIGLRLNGSLRAGATATDLVLTVTQMLRKKGVVNKFVEYYGDGIADAERGRSRDDRQHVARVWRDYRVFPGRRQTLDYLRLTGRAERPVALIEAYCKEQGLFRTARAPEPIFTDTARTRPRQGRTESRGAAPSAGSRDAGDREARLSSPAGQGVQRR